MDPIVTTLATNAVAALIPFMKKGAEKFATDFGEVAAEKAKSLFDTIDKRFSGDKEAADTLTHFEEKPEGYKDDVKKILEDKLAQDKEMVDELSRLLKDIGITLEITIDAEEAEKVIGLRSKALKRGKVKINEKTKKAEEVIGAEIDTIG